MWPAFSPVTLGVFQLGHDTTLPLTGLFVRLVTTRITYFANISRDRRLSA